VGQTAPAPQDKTIPVFGQTIHYFDVGSGPVVVLVHGLGDHKESWLRVMGPFAQKHRVLAPDQIGFGKSDKPLLDYSVQTYVDFLDEFLRQLKVEKVTLVGESLGGWISAMYAFETSDGRNLVPIDKLVLVDAAGLRQDQPPPVADLNASTLDGTRRLMHEVFYDSSWLTDERLRATFAEIIGRNDRYTVHSFLSNPTLRDELLDAKLAQIKTPTLVIWGREDALVPFTSGQRYAAGIPGAHLVAFDKCGHVPPAEKTTDFIAAVTSFLDGTATQ
jgi:pimeloyl-ACP methyl ester carboxylesterase